VAGFEQLLATVTAPSETAAAILEPVLGEGGYHQAPPAFVQRVADICRTHGILFIADEVQSGFGRTGKMFAIDHTGVEPDIICMAKGIASGFPFAALGTRRELDDLWPTGSHGGTYGGNPIGCAAALATIDIITSDGFLDNVNERGAQLLAGLRELAQAFPQLTNVRGVGMMIACDLNTAEVNTAVREHCLSKGRLLLMSAGTAGTTLRWMPPLTVTADEIDQALVAFGAALGSL
jgi:4-aminobutyrate aminotransferase-like enzyme